MTTLERIPSQDVNYYYDGNPFSSSYSSNTWGRLAAVQFYDQAPSQDPMTFTYQYNYNQAGRVTGNRTLVTNGSEITMMDLNASYAWDNQGKMTQMTYPVANGPNAPTGPTFNYTYDAMNRLNGMTETFWSYGQNQQWFQSTASQAFASNVTYNAAGQMTSMLIDSYASESRSYNNLMQLTGINGPGVNVAYNYASSAEFVG